ncbi:MAG: hypothetical protein COY38_01080 [Candidatus Aenigmarchaeota archaeon CG_4_10_14_0_8_um_filter_37_24]|nr:hypothetical protein [Candidatus Aenigmarchaeota archaeon]OIN86549.1 MAG: hypothetical protein AUJ50_03620 [Candidatus Aenigmarchaeota archaeon CG1_02_38_14]PIV69009.1 MAG: hypothetical protein COS07_02205 [Candidatus Aenigmarchaeota archaeon CG01_land_8_20_14_3_00_37_9]PIW41292.1 MAG: hypothetical protein COW21_02695 [Candidatus Aenigmarchaeota archaeon CG15_BIG_FIL_POST_REV_8_21_14_020_37_27]PIX50568.1 MAG: hypothetical protein COZ52_03595 [Candidatus Aenigmarchaeota archaeon CG_4_8_14_3_u
MKKVLILFIICLFSFSLASAANYESFVNVVGVDNQGKGIIGNVTVEIQPGKGRILVDTKPLQGIYTQDSERIAVKIASEITGFDFSNYDVIYSIITSNAHVIDGPSAGGALALATIAAVQEKDISHSFAMTGTIEDDGSIGEVGEILAKAKAATDHGVTVFLIPKGQSTQNQYVKKVKTPEPGWYIETIEPVSVNIVKYARDNWGMGVYEVSNIREAMNYAFGEIPTGSKKNLEPINSITLPKFTSPVGDYNDFSLMVEDELTSAENNYRKASTKLSNAMLPDDTALALAELMDMSKSYIDNAKEVDGRGYYYSVANEAFKSSITSNVVEDLIDYYTSSEKESYIKDRVDKTNQEINQTLKEVEDKSNKMICNPNMFEWAVAASQRITYAKNRMESIGDEDSSPVEVFYKVNTAEQWIGISRAFMKKTTIVSAGTDCLGKFKDMAEETLKEAENQLLLEKSMGYQGYDDAEWYLEAAKTEFENGWYIASIYDATSAKTRARIGSAYESKSLDEVYSEFNKMEVVPEDLLGTIFLENSYYSIYHAVRDNSESDALLAIQTLVLSQETNDVYLEIKNNMGEPSFDWSFDWNLKLTEKDYGMILIAVLATLVIYVFVLSAKVGRLERRLGIGRKKRKLR